LFPGRLLLGSLAGTALGSAVAVATAFALGTLLAGLDLAVKTGQFILAHHVLVIGLLLYLHGLVHHVEVHLGDDALLFFARISRTTSMGNPAMMKGLPGCLKPYHILPEKMSVLMCAPVPCAVFSLAFWLG
jgi:hypothetical protein